jgi:hypothetical protein
VGGALAAGNIQIDFTGTDYSFLEGTPFLLAMLVAGCLLLVLEWRWRSVADRRPALVLIFGASLVLGALLFAGALAQHGPTVWPGFLAGVVCAAIGAAATIPLLVRVRARLDPEAAGATPLFAEAAAILVAALSVLAPPIGPLALLALVWLLLSGRRRGPQKYAGLRILR